VHRPTVARWIERHPIAWTAFMAVGIGLNPIVAFTANPSTGGAVLATLGLAGGGMLGLASSWRAKPGDGAGPGS